MSYPARLPGGEVGDGLNNRYDMILLIKSGPCVTDPSALISGRNLSGANLDSVYLIGANLSETNLSKANLSKANLVRPLGLT